jgi:gas vesicle protein
LDPGFKGNRDHPGTIVIIHLGSEEKKMLEQNKSEHDVNRSSGNAERIRNGLLYFSVGATVGATLALLFAPKPGGELRGDIADVTRKGYDATLEKAIDLKDQSQAAVKAVRGKAVAIIDLAAAKFSTGTDLVADVVSATTGAVKGGI